MNQPVTYVELHSADLDATRQFFTEVFGWDPQPFAAPDYLVAPSGDEPGIDAGLIASRDDQPRTVATITVKSLEDSMKLVAENGGSVVVEPFTIPGVGRGCYATDPAGLLIGLHENDPDA